MPGYVRSLPFLVVFYLLSPTVTGYQSFVAYRGDGSASRGFAPAHRAPAPVNPGPEPADTIQWSPDHRLSFDDFLGACKDGHGDKWDTMAVCSYTIRYGFMIFENKPRIKAYAVFSRRQSWMKERIARVLEHEQGHFDIGQIYALRFQQKVNGESIADPHRFFEFLNTSLQQTVEECNAEQHKYDIWTMNTMGREHYLKWIREQLDTLGAYK